MKKLLLLFATVWPACLPQIALSQNSPCYWSGQLVKCFPTTGIYLDKQRSVRYGDSGTTNYVELKAPSSVTTYSMTWPSAQGGSSTYLKNNGSGVLSWGTGVATVPAAGGIVYSDGSALQSATGTSGGVPYFSSSNVPSSSAALTSGHIVTGGGAGGAPSTDTNVTADLSVTNTASDVRIRVLNTDNTAGNSNSATMVVAARNNNVRGQITAIDAATPVIQIGSDSSTKVQFMRSTTVVGFYNTDNSWNLGVPAASYPGVAIAGATDGSAAASGYVGQTVSATSTTNITTSNATVVSTSIPKGAWAVYCGFQTNNSSTASGAQICIDANGTGPCGTADSDAHQRPSCNTTGGSCSGTVGPLYISISSDTTYNCNANSVTANFGSTSNNKIWAVRVR